MPVSEGKIYNGFFLAILVVAIIVVVLCLCQCYKSNFTTLDPPINSNIIGVNVTLNSNLAHDTCPVTSLNEFTVADNLGIKKYREFYPDSLATVLSYVIPYDGATTVVQPNNPTANRLKDIITFLLKNDARFTIVCNTDYWSNNANKRPFNYGLLFKEMMKVKTNNGGYLVEAVHLGLDGGSTNPNQVEVNLRTAQIVAGTSKNPITDVVNNLISNLPTERQSGNLKIIISAQGDVCVDTTSPSDGWGEICGPSTPCKDGYGSIDWSTLKGLLTTQLQAVNKLGYPIYLATTKYPYYNVGGKGTDMTVSMPDTYAGAIALYIQSVANLNSALGTNFKPMIAETGWPASCIGGHGFPGKIPNMDPRRIRASSCNQSNMWKYFVSPLYKKYNNTSMMVNGVQYKPSDFTTQINNLERFWWVLSGDGTHVDCYNPANTDLTEGKYFRDNGWSMFTKRGDFKYPYPNLTIIDDRGSMRDYPPCVEAPNTGCPAGVACCRGDQNIPYVNARTGDPITPCCAHNASPSKSYIPQPFC